MAEMIGLQNLSIAHDCLTMLNTFIIFISAFSCGFRLDSETMLWQWCCSVLATLCSLGRFPSLLLRELVHPAHWIFDLSSQRHWNVSQLPTSNHHARCDLPGAGFPRLKPRLWAQQVIQLGNSVSKLSTHKSWETSCWDITAFLQHSNYDDSTLWCSSIKLFGQTSKLSVYRVRHWSSARMSKSLQIPSLPVNIKHQVHGRGFLISWHKMSL